MSKVGDFMSTTLYSVSPDENAYKAVEKMYQNNIGALLVKQGGEYVGMFTKTDWMILVLRGEGRPQNHESFFINDQTGTHDRL